MGNSHDGVQRRTVLKVLAIAPVAASVATGVVRPEQATAATVPDPVVPVPEPGYRYLIGVL
jgi:hypothetical protein